ncbi:MAG: SAM-dependent methyltransferase [Pseudomonadota bacterium]
MMLKDLLVRRIAMDGPMSVADYMTEALLHPAYGYYTSHDGIGAAGDFVTAPEISQMFGELIGLALAQSWLDQGAPVPFVLVELGPGRGTLMADILRAAAQVPRFDAAMTVALVEASPRLREIQRKTLTGYDVTWCDHVEELPAGPLWLVANEFFDALPIRQFVRDGGGWRERCVGLTDAALSFGLGPAGPQPGLAHRTDDTQDGDLVELCPSAAPIMTRIGRRIERHGGAALIIDYGDWRSLGDTLQAVKKHERTDPLAEPGRADLTAHVDFEALARAAAPARFARLTPQGVFLERLGITARAQALADRLSGHALEAHVAAHRRLTHPDEMGILFKVLGIYPSAAAPPPGLVP